LFFVWGGGWVVDDDLKEGLEHGKASAVLGLVFQRINSEEPPNSHCAGHRKDASRKEETLKSGRSSQSFL